MAQIIPPITSLPIDSSAAPSVEDIQDRLPSICVDYLSHDWSEEDVWASWRNMTRHKHEIANGVRLENASWRTWQKQRNNLKTISPETLNWLKDSDVTWLYGPLHTANVEPVRPLKVSSTGERLGLDVTSTGGPPGPRPSKPILKHRTLSEMLSITTPSSPVMEADTPEGEVDGLDQARPMLATTKSDTNILTTRPGMAIRRTSPTLPMGAFPSGNQGQGAAGGAGQKSPNAPGTRTPTEGNPPSSGKEKKHISFNTFVEQCIAVDDPSARENNMWQESEDDDMLEMRSHRSSSSKSSRPSISRHSSSSSTRSQQEPLTIAKIAPTMLKTQTYANSEQLPQMVYQPPPQYLSPQISPGVHSPVGPSSYSSQASTASTGSTGTAQGKKWDDDDGQPYDYFGGPDRSSGPAQGSGQVAQAQSPAQNIPQRAPAPVVAQPPQQPKWRQGQQQQQQQVGSIDSTLSTSASSSSSSSSLARDNITSPPQPSRSILKQRSVAADASNTAEADFDSGSPPGNYFNYNPSAATGIGGMRAAQYLDQNPSGQGGNASPLVSPATGEERGRSTARGGTGTSQYDRSISRSTNSSAGSVTGGANSGAGGNASGQGPMSPGTSRSPSGSTHGHATSGVSKKGPAQQQAQQQKVHAAQQANTQAQQQQQQRQAEVAAEADNGMEIDHDESPDRGASTPTPHSSPQILFRPLQDTSPASLPHVSTSLASLPHASYPAPPSRSPRSPHASPPTSGEASPETPLSPYASRNPSSPVASHLPRADEPKATSPPSGPPLAVGTAASGSAGSDAARHARGMGGKATTASIGTMAAAPHIYQNATASNRTARTGQGRPQGQAQTQGLGLGQAIDTPGKSAPMGSTTTGQAQAQAQRNYEQFPPPTSATTSTAPASSSSATLSTGNTGAHAGTNASTSTSTGTGAGINRWVRPNTTAYPDHFPRSGVEDDEDGGSIMGRAANIASTARDLFGALWYGAHGAGGSGLVSGQVSGRDASYAGRQIHAQAQAQAQAQIPGQAQAPGHEQGQGPPRREEQQAIDHRVAEQSARRGGRHTRGKSIG